MIIMNIGIFDSGLGGLLIAKAIIQRLPQYDYIYLGDTKNLPYGNRSQAEIYRLTRRAVEYLFKRDCQLVILACNTASTRALRRLQREYLPKHYPDQRILGVIIPLVEAAVARKSHRVGVLATRATVGSRAFVKEFRKAQPRIQVLQQAAPQLVSLIEANELQQASEVLMEYLRPLLRQRVDTILLGCTHYPLIKRQTRNLAGRRMRILAQDDIIPDRLADYLSRHPEIKRVLSRDGRRKFLVTQTSQHVKKLARQWFGKRIKLGLVKI